MPKPTIHELIAKDKYEEVEQLLKKRPTAVNQPAGMPVLSHASLYGKGDLPLTIAIGKRSEAMIKLLLQNGADPNQFSVDSSSLGYRGFSPLFYVCFVGLDDILELIIKESKVTLNLNITVAYKVTIKKVDMMAIDISLISVACINNHLNIVKILLKNHANPNHIFKYNKEETVNEFLVQQPSKNKVGKYTHLPCELIAQFSESSPLAISAKLGYVTIVNELIAEPLININQPLKSLEFETSALNSVIHSKYISDKLIRKKIVELLISKEANFSEIEGMTPTCVAVINNQHEILKLLIEKGADVNEVLQNGIMTGGTPLKIACIAANLECIDLLLNNGANPNQITYEYEGGKKSWVITPLITAIDNKKISSVTQAKVITKLLLKGADIYFTISDIPGYKGYSALELAVEICHFDVIKLLLVYMKNRPHLKREFILTKTLVHAVGYAKPEIVALLLDYIEQPNRPIFGDVDKVKLGMTPLMAACFRGDETILKMLLQRGVKVNQVMEGGVYLHPIVLAAASGHINMVKLLIDNGANIFVANTRKPLPHFNALSAAVLYKHLNILKYLLEIYPDILISSDLPGIPPLFIAIEENNIEALKLLLKFGADPNKNLELKDGTITPLFNAILEKRIEMIKLLVAAGAKINNPIYHITYKSLLPITYAILEQDIQLTEVLYNCGADIHLPNQQSTLLLNSLQTAIINCDSYRRADILSILLSKFLSEKDKKLFERYINKDKVSTLFAIVLIGNVPLIDLLIKQTTTPSIFINQKILLGKYKGESALAAAALSGNVGILYKFINFECDWDQIIRSDRIENRSIREIAIAKISDKEFKESFLLHLNKEITFFGKNIDQKKMLNGKNDVIDNDSLHQISIRIDKVSANLQNLFFQYINKSKQYYYIYHATQDLNELNKIIKKYPNDNSSLFELIENNLITNLISEHALRILQALVEYSKIANDMNFIPTNICWTLRNILMHDFDTLTLPMLYNLSYILITELLPTLEYANLYAEFIHSRKYDLTSSQQVIEKKDFNKIKSHLAGVFTLWLDRYYNKQNLTVLRNEFRVIISEIDKINLFIDRAYTKQGFELSREFVKAVRTSEMHIGAMYQSILKNDIARPLINQQFLQVKLEECRIIRDIIGHEYQQEKIGLESQINVEDIYTIAKRIASTREQLLKLAGIYDAELKTQNILVSK